MPTAEDTALTDRQVEVLELREAGLTQREVAERLGTTASNVSAVERAAEANVGQARRTLELVRTLRSPVRFTAEAGTYFEDLVDAVYEHGDEAGIKVDYCTPELNAHLYGELEDHVAESRLDTAVEVGLTEGGEVKVYVDGA